MKQISCIIFTLFLFSCGSTEVEEVGKKTISLAEIKKEQPVETTVEEEVKEEVEPISTDVEEVPEEYTEKTVERIETPKEDRAVAPKTVAKKETPKKEKPKRKKRPKISFEKTSYNFGLIDEGEKVSYKFFFENTGNAPLLIKDASATCGCTYPGYPFVPIKPGERSSINVSFDSKGKFGKQKPVVTVLTNASSKPYKLYFEGEVRTEVVDN